MKAALTILCSLLLVWAPAAVASAPAGPAAHHCHCGRKMACCQKSPAPASQPISATAPGPAQNQVFSPAPATVLWVLPAIAASSPSPSVAPSLTAGMAPIFARNCTWLI